MSEICGDGRLPIGRRLAYLLRNTAVNLLQAGIRPRIDRGFPIHLDEAYGAASPSRALTDSFLRMRLPQVIPLGPIRVLEIGCGSGSLCRKLAAIGYTGSYTGIDIHDRFNHEAIPGFSRQFICDDAHRFDPGESRFDLIVSISALEHIPADIKLISRLPDWLAPNGREIHFLPSGWALLTYLWHGWRQYPLRSIGKRFGHEAVAAPLGGLASTSLHFAFITAGELLLPLKARKRWPALYAFLRDRCLRLDRYVPCCPTMYVVRRESPGQNENKTGENRAELHIRGSDQNGVR